MKVALKFVLNLVFKTITVLIKTKAEDLYNREVLRRTWTQALIKQDHRYAFLVGMFVCFCDGTQGIHSYF